MKNKLINLLIVFLLLIPFRLPISILLVRFFNFIVKQFIETIPVDVLATNVIMTKTIYNLALSSYFVYKIESLARQYNERKARTKDNYSYSKDIKYNDENCYWYTLIIAIILFIFLILDAISINRLFY